MRKKVLVEKYLGVFVIDEKKPGILEPNMKKDPFAEGQDIKETAKFWILYYSDGTKTMKVQSIGESPVYFDFEEPEDEDSFIEVSSEEMRSKP